MKTLHDGTKVSDETPTRLVNGKRYLLTQEEIDQREAEAEASQLAMLPDYNEKKRENLISQGATFDGITIKTDDRTLVFFTNLFMQANADSQFTYDGFNAINGRFNLTNAQIKGLYAAGQTAIKGAFDIYNAVDAKIDNGTIATTAEIDSEYES